MSGKVRAFAQYGVKLRNDVWSWSGVSDEGEVVLALWQDEFDCDARPVSYSDFASPTLEQWRYRTGNKFRIKDLIYAREHCGGRFRVVMVEAVDLTAEPRKISSAFARRDLVMQLDVLDEETGQLRAHLVVEQA